MSIFDSNAQAYLNQTAEETAAIQKHFLENYGAIVVQAAKRLGQAVIAGKKLLIVGNGGSAADAQHMAAEMVGRMLVERRALPAIALTTDSSNLTALGNDYGYEHVFARQIDALGQEGDVLLAISTSGNSPNVLRAIESARRKKMGVIGLTGGTGGKMKALCDLSLIAELGKNSSRIQETHIFAVHSMVDLMDRFFLAEPARG